MAAVVALMAKDRGRPNIRCQLLLWPVTNAAFDTTSYDEFAEGYFLTRNMMKWFWDSYTIDPRERQDVYASPLQAANERLRGVAPAIIQTAEMDVLRDEGEAYARKLDRAGVDVTCTRYNGLIHDYGLLNAIRQVPGVRSAMLQAGRAEKTYRLALRAYGGAFAPPRLRPGARNSERPHAVGQSGRLEPEKPGSATAAVDFSTRLGDRSLDVVALEAPDVSICEQRRGATGNKCRAAARRPWAREGQRLVKPQLPPAR
jgi:alpha/beta hydrolase fold